MNVNLKCNCGRFQGVAKNISTNPGRRVICYCDDCQAYAHYLGQAKKILDKNGGTDIYTTYPAEVQITKGTENLKCLRLSKKGIMRWYAGCCKTPIGNTNSSDKTPYIGMIDHIFDFSNKDLTKDEILGNVHLRIHGKFGKGTLPKETAQTVSLKGMLAIIKFIAKGFLKRANKPHPFFDSETHRPIVIPYIFSHEERDNLRPLTSN